VLKTAEMNKYIDNSCKINEASVRMKAVNNIVIVLCAIHNLTFREDRLSYSDEKRLFGQ